MPLIMVRRNGVSDTDLERVLDALPKVVAEALSFGLPNADTQLTEKEIEVWVSESHPFDRNALNLGVMIFAHDYPERRENLEDRRREITNKIMEMLLKSENIDLRGWAWVFLGHSDFDYIWGSVGKP